MQDRVDFKAILDRLSSAEFSAKLNLASGLKTATNIILSDPDVVSAIDMCRGNKRLVGVILEELKRLSVQTVDYRYESPHDSALAAMLVTVKEADPLSVEFAISIVQRAQQTWWAGKIAARFLSDIQRDEGITDVTGTMAVLEKSVSLVDYNWFENVGVTDFQNSDSVYLPALSWSDISWHAMRLQESSSAYFVYAADSKTDIHLPKYWSPPNSLAYVKENADNVLTSEEEEVRYAA